MKNYVISLTNACDRRNHISREFGKQGIDFEFFDAITPSQINEISIKFGIDLNKTDLSSGEIGCLLSHLCLWQKAIDNNWDNITIFEDDVYLGENSAVFLNTYDWLPKNFDAIKLETVLTPVHLSNPTKIHDRKLCTLNTFHYGTGAYVISKQCIIELLSLIQKQEKITTIDDILFNQIIKSKNVLQLTPALCIQEVVCKQGNLALNSDLESHRKNHQFIKPKRTLSQKIIRELKALSNKTRLKLWGEIVKFE
ncbi:glycosyltransferase family 25 protein [Moraxella nasovis]|uniref:glycosyltransferase family 25 protein n=1 Tax=Moraxella nasovis TaxID=2904121 RepID=UPI001F622923|nr:glycosyltransferase family 25 protein [Moraxella nasovis]UNU73143.1 glycosyltransferase family 25 protein [Moraxella nasovis]